MTAEDLIQFLIENGKQWVEAQRNLHRASGRLLTPVEQAAFGPFFGKGILQIARVKHVPVIQNPPFYKILEARRVPLPLDFTGMEGITFVDTILVSDSQHQAEGPVDLLLFHELVHMVQYAMLGIAGFVERYVRGWAEAGRDYLSIPLEKDAYLLQASYEAEPDSPFSVEEVVQRQLGLI